MKYSNLFTIYLVRFNFLDKRFHLDYRFGETTLLSISRCGKTATEPETKCPLSYSSAKRKIHFRDTKLKRNLKPTTYLCVIPQIIVLYGGLN